ncbi:TVP38/TMEM64 family protein [Brachybacterium sp. DNPG3]
MSPTPDAPSPDVRPSDATAAGTAAPASTAPPAPDSAVAASPQEETGAGSRRGTTPWGTYLRNGALALAILGMIWLAANVRLPDLDTLREDIQDLGPWAPLGFVVIYALVALTPIPVTITAVAGGMVFGLGGGTLLSMVGVVLGCWGAYWIARLLGRDVVMRLLGSHADVVEERLEDGGFWAVCTLRLMPGLPYWPVNYGSGALGVSTREFLIATCVASLPGQLSLVAIGAFIVDPGIPQGTAVVLAWILVGVLTVLSFRRWRAAR